MGERLSNRLRELHEKYFDLVHYARRDPDEANPAILPHLEVIRQAYPREVYNLANEDETDWHHGFNSGMLAAIRLVGAYLSKRKREIAQAEEEFPSLDT